MIQDRPNRDCIFLARSCGVRQTHKPRRHSCRPRNYARMIPARPPHHWSCIRSRDRRRLPPLRLLRNYEPQTFAGDSAEKKPHRWWRRRGQRFQSGCSLRQRTRKHAADKRSNARRQALADIVIRVTFKREGYALRQECTQTLSGRAFQLNPNGYRRRTLQNRRRGRSLRSA